MIGRRTERQTGRQIDTRKSRNGHLQGKLVEAHKKREFSYVKNNDNEKVTIQTMDKTISRKKEFSHLLRSRTNDVLFMVSSSLVKN